MASGRAESDGASVLWWFGGAGLAWAYSWVVPDGLDVLTLLSAIIAVVLAVVGLVSVTIRLVRRIRPVDSPPAASVDPPG